jgi:Arc/MetJ family transcription regulator
MRTTTIAVDDNLMAEALRATGLKTKREAVEAGFRLLARRARQAAAAELFGAVDWRGDLDAQRRDDGRAGGDRPAGAGR